MCQSDQAPKASSGLVVPLRQPPSVFSPVLSEATPLSRRRRLWELDDHAHCPVVGVCLPLPALRRLVAKLADSVSLTEDYALHCTVVAACKTRSAMADLLQKDLDRRYQLSIQHANKLKSEEALRQWWQAGQRGQDLAGTFWALLTSSRCTPSLEQQVLGDIHMLQHQMSSTTRNDQAQLNAMLEENAILTRELARAQHRSQQMVHEHAAQVSRLEQQAIRLRADMICQQTDLARVKDQLAALQTSTPDLPPRLELARQCKNQAERIVELQRALATAQHHADRQRLRTANASDAIATISSRVEQPAPPANQTNLSSQSVLCVGGRANVIPIYRQLVERSGGHFLHHDGGMEENTTRLDATLAAADLVICQTGCISHNAYWRVKHHCKRTGKRCVFVDTPSGAALAKALQDLSTQD